MATSGESLVGKVALVTGSTDGIGLILANALAGKGCNVIITGFGDEATIQGILKNLREQHKVQADFVDGDLTKVSDIEKMVESVNQLYPEGVDILINNAGIFHFVPIEDFPKKKWDDFLAIMLSAPFHLIQGFLPGMRKKGWGRIVNMSSQLGLVSARNKAAYSTVKFGIIGLTKGVALDTAKDGVTCNAVCPTFVRTPGFLKEFKDKSRETGCTEEEAEREYTDLVPTGELVSPEQVSDLVVFLCGSVASSQMTGATYLLDGGYTAQ